MITTIRILKYSTSIMFLCSPLGEVSSTAESTLAQCGSAELSAEDQELLKLYHHTFDDEWVDLDLIMDLLHNICSTTTDGEVQHSYIRCRLKA